MHVTDFLAIYAAILSTVIFFWDVARTRSKVRVELLPGTDEVDGKLASGAYLSVQNRSAHTIHLSNVSLLYPFTNPRLTERLDHLIRFRRIPWRIGWVHCGLSSYNIKDGFPISIEARQSHGFLIPDVALREVLSDAVRTEIRAVTQDALWRNTYSNRLKVDWLDAAR